MSIRIDWHAIRPLNGGREKMFEELCTQLARAESPAGSTFVRKATPDAGVECYAVLASGAEWGWQSKYVHGLEDSQWSQIDGSIRSALEKHPRLVRYFVCAPVDRADGRRPGTKSAMERWNDHVAKWSGWASDRGMTVDFEYWGSHELIERLSQQKNAGKLWFFFDKRGLDEAWFSARLEEAVHSAGARYTPELHFELPIAWEFEAFGRTQRFFDRQKTAARRIREELRKVEMSEGATDPDVDTAVVALSSNVEAVLAALGAIGAQPTGPLPFNDVSQRIRMSDEAAEGVSRVLAEREQALETARNPADREASRSSYRGNPFRNRQSRVFRLRSELRRTTESLAHAQQLASSPVLLLRGAAGSGKTHLLCDVARRRNAAGHPTVLLMGQRFTSDQPPWIQALQQLDLVSLSAEEFVGALEAAAQAADSRALLIVDAINEGKRRHIWPSHLAAFLTSIARSPWIGLVLSVRSSYEKLVVPSEVRERVLAVTHEGFTDHEYDATKAFFVHHKLELPSTPLLSPEFRNPLFLKTLCRGLQARKERRLPRGFQGITAIFDLYLSAVNGELAPRLSFHAGLGLVRRAVEDFADASLESGQPWLTLTKAMEIVDACLPGREYERSLYRGLVEEGILVEDIAESAHAEAQEIVYLAYERFTDHLWAKTLIDKHLDLRSPASAFATGGPLAFICDTKNEGSPGLLEALCIQVPERTGSELIELAPGCEKHWGLKDAFWQSLVWRAYAALSDGTLATLNRLCQNEQDERDVLDVLLTVAVLPEHRFNARFLDRRLKKDALPDRDAWWSIYIHHARGTHGALDRLVDWAASMSAATSIDDETLDLCWVTLSWTFTSSDRILRDRATKALVSLLTGRLAAVVRLIEWFATVDDPYVAERVYAVAYGVALRSTDPGAVGTLARCVYNRVFASGSPPPHILLRDYARGVVERALYLGSSPDVVPQLIRPPYKSTWPQIPTEEDIKPLLPNWSEGSSYDSRALEWARNRIGSSVMEDDFARYVIGTNSSSTNWLALRLEEPPWQPPPRTEDQLRALLDEFSSEESSAWEEYDAAAAAFPELVQSFIENSIAERREKGELIFPWDIVDLGKEVANSRPIEVAAIRERMEQAKAALQTVLTKDHAQRLEEIRTSQEGEDDLRRPLRFDLRLIQRYILWRVFDLGWTIERFGQFDRFASEDGGREASKVERIGKKYQWIAYHEIMAFVADHFQYRELYREEQGDQVYEGPWQENLRDIDPSCTIRILTGGTSWDGHTPAWWGAARYDSWGEPSNPREWVMDSSALPNFEELLLVTDPANGSRWLNCEAHFSWREQPPPDRDASDIERRELWYMCTGYLLRAEDAEPFLKWAESVDFSGRWMPDAADSYRTFLGEHAWAPADRYFQTPYHGERGWTQPREGCPVKVRTMAFKYSREHTSLDSSIDDSYELRLPIGELVTGLGLHWSGNGADFLDQANQLAAQDPTVHTTGPDALLIREDILRRFLAEKNLTVCWAIIGEKRILGPTVGFGPRQPSMRMSGAYVLGPSGLVGFIDGAFDDVEEDTLSSKPVKLVRSGM